ncbi:MAG: hypothetical protein HUK03_10430, partial [Bacteroidaceae bacterium]|nr:hypothetical protein [Bacteroidaceae bacterium]
VYWRTGSIWLPLIGHVMNNSVAVVMYHVLGFEQAEEFRFLDHMGGPVVGNVIAVALLAAGLLIFYRINKTYNG